VKKKKIFILLFFGFLLYLVFDFYQSLRQSVWDGENNLNFVIQAEERIFLYSYHPQDDLLNIISLPENLLIELAKDYGEYQLKNIYRLGEMEKIGGGRLLQMSLQNFFKVPLEGEFISPSNTGLEKGKLSSLYLCLLVKRCETSLNWWDLTRIFSQFSQLKLNQVRLLKIEETNLFKKERLADQSEAMRLETSLIDDFSQKYFTDKNFLNAGLKISVVNATHYAGLAKASSRLLKNIGGEVITSEDADQVSDQSFIYYAEEGQRESYSVKKISQIFQIKQILFKPETEGDIVIFLGKDFLDSFYLQ
jgi:hypothetical protein